MANLIQIKRSESTATPGSLANGELAFSAASNVLFIGMQDAVVPIAGGRNPGTLVANQAIVVNASSLVDTIKVGNTGTNVTTDTGGIFLANSTSNTKLTIPSSAEWTSGSYWLNANGQWSTIASSATSLDGLDDVTITSVTNNDLFVFDNGTSQWVNKAAGNGFTFSSQAPSVLAANGIQVTSDGVNVLAGNSQIVSNTTGIWINEVTASQVTGDIALGTQTSGNYVATITAGNGLTGDGTGEGSTPTLVVGAGNGITVNVDDVAVNANSGLVSNSTGVFVNANSGIVANSTGTFVEAGTGVTANATGVHIGQAVETTSAVTFEDLTVNGNTVLGSDTADRISITGYVNSAVIPAVNITYDLGTNELRWNNVYSRHIVANTITIDADATVTGNLVVIGDLVTLNVATITIEDPLIELARNNTSTDVVDIGFYGLYNADGGEPEHTGLFRDATDSKYKIFNGLTVTPTTTVDIGGAGYTQGTLVAYIEAGGLIANATHVALTADSTVNVSITANSLSLSSPLVGTSGGTGLAAYTAEDILVANSTNGFRKLGVGTEGFVLQVSSGVVTYNSLDGGTF